MHCGVRLQETQGDDEGCRAGAVNQLAYRGLALTTAEQASAKAAGLDVGEALSRKAHAIFGSDEHLSGDELVRRRELIERAALDGGVPPPTPSTASTPLDAPGVVDP